MNNDFIKIKNLSGELKISHKMRGTGITISTTELVLQKPHVNYHIQLEDIVSIVPCRTGRGMNDLTFINQRRAGTEIISSVPNSDQYKCYVRQATIHNRSGLHQIERAEFILPLHTNLLRVIAEYGGLNVV
jgi:hypothetical protein